MVTNKVDKSRLWGMFAENFLAFSSSPKGVNQMRSKVDSVSLPHLLIKLQKLSPVIIEKNAKNVQMNIYSHTCRIKLERIIPVDGQNRLLHYDFL